MFAEMMPTTQLTRNEMLALLALKTYTANRFDVWMIAGNARGPAAQIACLSYLDGTDYPPATIFVLTTNDDSRFEARLLSRLHRIEFSSYGMRSDASDLLARIWQSEAPSDAQAPDFVRIVKDAANNIRGAVMALETKLMEV